MSRMSKIVALLIVIVFLLACNFVTEPLRNGQNLVETAQSATTLIPVETLQALASAIPAGTLEALPSTIPTFESLATQVGNYFDPQGAPVQEWRGIPIMPQATVGQEFSDTNTYSFKTSGTVQEVQDFYNAELTALGWNQPFNIPLEAEGGIMVFEKDGTNLTITITSLEGSVVVLLLLA